MNPVMARCSCGWPVLKCSDCAPTPADLADDVEAPLPVVIRIVTGPAAIAAFIVIGGTAALTWAAGAVLDALRDRP